MKLAANLIILSLVMTFNTQADLKSIALQISDTVSYF